MQRELDDLPKAPKTPFIDDLTTFSGFLSYPKIKILCDRLPEMESQNFQRDVKLLIEDLREFCLGKSDRFKPEISLLDYANRPEAFEELVNVAKLIPTRPFSWNLDVQSDASATGVLQLEVQVSNLLKAVNDDKFEAKLNKALGLVSRQTGASDEHLQRTS